MKKLLECCRSKPNLFQDRKTGSTETKYVISCSCCGNFTDGLTEEHTRFKWNSGFREVPEPDQEFVEHLKTVNKLFRKPKKNWGRKRRTSKNFKKVRARDGLVCQYCGFDMSGHVGDGTISVDHIHPVCRGGGNHMDNLVVSCMTCNNIASGTGFKNFSTKKKHILTQRQIKGYPVYN